MERWFGLLFHLSYQRINKKIFLLLTIFLNITFLCLNAASSSQVAQKSSVDKWDTESPDSKIGLAYEYHVRSMWIPTSTQATYHQTHFSDEDIFFSCFHFSVQRINHTCMYKHNGFYNQGVAHVTLEQVYVCCLVVVVYTSEFSEINCTKFPAAPVVISERQQDNVELQVETPRVPMNNDNKYRQASVIRKGKYIFVFHQLLLYLRYVRAYHFVSIFE